MLLEMTESQTDGRACGVISVPTARRRRRHGWSRRTPERPSPDGACEFGEMFVHVLPDLSGTVRGCFSFLSIERLPVA